jgi:hypothetical protein
MKSRTLWIYTRKAQYPTEFPWMCPCCAAPQPAAKDASSTAKKPVFCETCSKHANLFTKKPSIGRVIPKLLVVGAWYLTYKLMPFLPLPRDTSPLVAFALICLLWMIAILIAGEIVFRGWIKRRRARAFQMMKPECAHICNALRFESDAPAKPLGESGMPEAHLRAMASAYVRLLMVSNFYVLALNEDWARAMEQLDGTDGHFEPVDYDKHEDGKLRPLLRQQRIVKTCSIVMLIAILVWFGPRIMHCTLEFGKRVLNVMKTISPPLQGMTRTEVNGVISYKFICSLGTWSDIIVVPPGCVTTHLERPSSSGLLMTVDGSPADPHNFHTKSGSALRFRSATIFCFSDGRSLLYATADGGRTAQSFFVTLDSNQRRT